MKVYTEAECDRLYQETLSYEQIETNIRGFDVVETSKSKWDEEKYYYADLSSGIALEIFDSQILLDSNQLTEHAERQYFTAKFYLSGNHNVICPGIDGVAAEYAEIGGQNYLFYLPNIEEIEQSWAGDRLQMLKVMVEFDTVRRFVTKLNTVPQQLQALIEKDNPQRFHFTVGDVTPQMQTIIRQIWQHPYQDAIARMYLEAKVLELLAVVVLDTAPLDAALALGIQPIGTYIFETFPQYLEENVENVKDIAIVGKGNQPSLEKILQLKPDLILGSKLVSSPQQYQLLSQIAPTVLTEGSARQTDWKPNFKLYAEALGQPELAKQLLERYQQRVDQLRQKIPRPQAITISVLSSYNNQLDTYTRALSQAQYFPMLGFLVQRLKIP